MCVVVISLAVFEISHIVLCLYLPSISNAGKLLLAEPVTDGASAKLAVLISC